MNELITIVVTGLLSGGMGAGVATLIKARAEARGSDATTTSTLTKLPAEVDSVVVQGAEAAVLTMRAALESASQRIGELEQDRRDDRARIDQLERKVEELRAKVEAAERALGDAREAGAELRRELTAFARDRDTRR